MIVAEFSWPVRVYYEDTDSGGVVYYANYLKFMERARTEWLRARGVEQDVLAREHGLIFAVRSLQMEYLKPARFNQLLSVSVKVMASGKASLSFEQTVNLITNKGTEGEASGALLCQGQVKIACLDAVTLKPRAMPVHVREEILRDS